MNAGRGLRALVVSALCAALAGCPAHLRQQTRFRSQVQTDAGAFVLEYAGIDRESRARVERSVRAATEKLVQWGGLNEPVTIHILPTHDELEHAVNRHGFEWLRAWARYDEIFLQSPRTWSVFTVPQADVDELMLHELTHAVMYQQAADRTHWSRKEIPVWFREGMASWTADQGYRWPTLEDLARFYDRHRDRDPVGDPEPLYQRESSIVYGAAHHAFSFLVRRYGQDKVRELLRTMREGSRFQEAFQSALGLSVEQFVSDFKRYVRLRGFKGGRIRRLRPGPRIAPPAPAPHGARALDGSEVPPPTLNTDTPPQTDGD